MLCVLFPRNATDSWACWSLEPRGTQGWREGQKIWGTVGHPRGMPIPHSAVKPHPGFHSIVHLCKMQKPWELFDRLLNPNNLNEPVSLVQKQVFGFGWMMPVSYAGKFLSNCIIDLRLNWASQQSFSEEPSQAESPRVRHSLHQLEVQGWLPVSAWPPERQQPLQTRGNMSPTSISWQWIHLVLEEGYGLLSPVYFTQRSEGEKPQNVNRQLVAHCFFPTFGS